MRFHVSTIAALLLLAGSARAESSKPVVFVRVDSVRIEKNEFFVSGLVEGETKPVVWTGVVGGVAVSSIHPALQTCSSMALFAMDRPGKVKLEVSQPPAWHMTCALVRVEPPG